jgi:PilZ domain
MAKENRGKTRRRVIQQVRIFVDNRPITGVCAMLDVSATGAQIRLDATADLPDEFTLVLSRGGAVRRQCWKVWQHEDRVGIRFAKLNRNDHLPKS